MTFVAYHKFQSVMAPKPYNFEAMGGKNKTIVVIGGGMVGLTSAYILAKKYPNNQIVVVERNSKPMEETSKQNGNLLPVNFNLSWMNFPIYPFVFKALFDWKEYESKIYLTSFFQSFCNIAITAKFGLIWFFRQPNELTYGKATGTLYKNSRLILKQIIKDEGLREKEDFGYVDSMQSLILKKEDGPWTDLINGASEVFPDQSIVVLSRSKDPENYQKNVDDCLPHLKGLKRYNCALYREMNTINTTQFGQKLWEITDKLENVEIKCNSEVTGYEIEAKTNIVKAVKIGKTTIQCDQVILCNGPQAPKHIWDHFHRSVLPGLHGMGYTFDIKFDKPFPVRDFNMLPDNDGYAYCQWKDDTVRFSVLCDFGIFTKPFIDKERIAYGMKQVARDIGTTVEDIDSRALQLRSCFRPMSPDDFMIVGPMKHYPNVMLNVGYGSQGWQCFSGAKIIEGIIEPSNELNEIFDKETRHAVRAERMYI